MTLTAAEKSTPTGRIHWAWVVTAVSFIAILGAAGFRSVRHIELATDVIWPRCSIPVQRRRNDRRRRRGRMSSVVHDVHEVAVEVADRRGADPRR